MPPKNCHVNAGDTMVFGPIKLPGGLGARDPDLYGLPPDQNLAVVVLCTINRWKRSILIKFDDTGKNKNRFMICAEL